MSFRQDRTNPSTAVSNWHGRSETPKGWPSTRVSTWMNGGLFGAGAGAAGFEKIGSTNAGGTTTVTFTGIDSTKYQTYMVVWKTINTTTTLDNRVRLNGTDDTSGNIYQSNWRYKGSSGNVQSNQNAETYPMVGGTPKGSGDDQVFSQTWVCGPSLAGTGKPMYQYWGSLNAGSNPIRVGFAYNTAFSTAALTNATTIITVNNGTSSQNFPAGTIVSAYGYRLAS